MGMDNPKITQIPQDDFMDVLEITKDLQKYMDNISLENGRNIAMTAIINSTINSIFNNSGEIKDVIFYRNVLVELLDSSIKEVQDKTKKNPPN